MASAIDEEERKRGRNMQPGYTRAWEVPIPAGDPRDIAALRAQRAEVDAMLGYRYAEDAHQKARAWWRLVQARRARHAIQVIELPALPLPPPGALTFVQKILRRLGLFRTERATVPSYLR
ncbi:MAG: hypothetical protein JWO26_787 [Rhodospirillales bacterium]|nr:hypothetical protein [Rhodospirillales bacterium]